MPTVNLGLFSIRILILSMFFRVRSLSSFSLTIILEGFASTTLREVSRWRRPTAGACGNPVARHHQRVIDSDQFKEHRQATLR